MLCDNLEGEMRWEVGGKSQRKGTYAYLWLIHVDIQQKSTQYCKAIIFQLKINKEKKKRNCSMGLSEIYLRKACTCTGTQSMSMPGFLNA